MITSAITQGGIISIYKLCAVCNKPVRTDHRMRNITRDGSIVAHADCSLPTNIPPDDGGTPGAIKLEKAA